MWRALDLAKYRVLQTSSQCYDRFCPSYLLTVLWADTLFDKPISSTGFYERHYCTRVSYQPNAMSVKLRSGAVSRLVPHNLQFYVRHCATTTRLKAETPNFFNFCQRIMFKELGLPRLLIRSSTRWPQKASNDISSRASTLTGLSHSRSQEIAAARKLCIKTRIWLEKKDSAVIRSRSVCPNFLIHPPYSSIYKVTGARLSALWQTWAVSVWLFCCPRARLVWLSGGHGKISLLWQG